MRARDAKPGEKTIYDRIHHGHTQIMLWDEDGNEVSNEARVKVAQKTFYNQADAAEDRALFPEELSGQMSELFREDVSSMTVFEKGGVDMARWVADLDTDEELESDYDEDSQDSMCPSCRGSVDGDHTHKDKEGDDEDWSDTDSADASANEGGSEFDRFNKFFNQSLNLSSREKQMINFTKFFKGPAETDTKHMEREFMSFVDRERARGKNNLCHDGEN